MTKKDFDKLARLISDTRPGDAFVDGLIEVLKVDNPRFDERRFREACGYFDGCLS